MHQEVDAVVIGAGAGGMAAATVLGEAGATVAMIDRERWLGGILPQCIHNGFGIHDFGEELTGPEYAERLAAWFDGPRATTVQTYLRSAVVSIDYRPTDTAGAHSFRTTTVSPAGVRQIDSRIIMLAMGCRERTRGSMMIPGTRPAGVYTAGAAQRLVNIEGVIPGRNIVVVGSGDIGLIMARRLSWVGSKVHAVVEIKDKPSGLARNITQCLEDFAIPLYLGHEVAAVHGYDRVEAVDIRDRTTGSLVRIPCDTVLLSTGLIPENELSRGLAIAIDPLTGGPKTDTQGMTELPGVFAVGNVRQVYDLVDTVTRESRKTAAAALAYLAGERPTAATEPARPSGRAPGMDPVRDPAQEGNND